MRRFFILIPSTVILLFTACKQEFDPSKKANTLHKVSADTVATENQRSVAAVKKELTTRGYQVFDYIDAKTGDTTLMQQYFIAFLKRGPNRSQNKAESDSLQALHLAHLGRMYEEGYADISGPFGDDGEVRGITIYNVPTLKMADSLANMDPMVRAGRLVIEVRPWWAAKGFPLR
ncbi:YciI family protein [Altibacter lentus]|uniref:YciI family protein n=1 Tax=Altibacter lentus TaxID=1223410 RepID=UPI000A0238DA|nr:YciI family protein [Altibacter lentus]